MPQSLTSTLNLREGRSDSLTYIQIGSHPTSISWREEAIDSLTYIQIGSHPTSISWREEAIHLHSDRLTDVHLFPAMRV